MRKAIRPLCWRRAEAVGYLQVGGAALTAHADGYPLDEKPHEFASLLGYSALHDHSEKTAPW
jgi:hypothetical protein